MRCTRDFEWFYGNGNALNIIIAIILLGIIAYLIIHIIYFKNSGRYNHYPKHNDKCPNCNTHIEPSYIRCPECHHRLKNNCTTCGKVIKTTWDICPYCEAEVKPNPNKIQHQRL